MYKDAPVQFNYYSMVEARALVTNYYQPTRARRLWRHYLSSLTGGAGSLLLTVVFYPLFSRRMDTRAPAHLVGGGAFTEQVQGLALPHSHRLLRGAHNFHSASGYPGGLVFILT